MFWKLRSSKIVKILQLALVCFQVCKLHHEKIFFHGGNKQLFFLIFTMKLYSVALNYLNAHSTLNFARTFLYFETLTIIKHRARFEFYEKQLLILGGAIERCPGSLCLEGNCQTCNFTGVFEDFGHIFLTCSEKITEILKVGKIFRYATDFNFKFNR